MANRRRSSKSSSSGDSFPVIDFTKAEDGGGGKRFKENDYLVKVLKKVKPGKSENKGTPFIEFAFQFKDGKYKGKTFTQRLYTSPKALWLLRSFIEAVGEDVPDKVRWKSIAKLVIGKDVVVTLTDNENPESGKISSQISDFLDPEEFDEDEDDDDDEDVDDDDLDEDEDDEEDEDEDDEDDDDEDEEDEEPEPRRRKKSSRSKSSSKKSSKSSSRKRKRKADDDEDDDLEDIDLDDI